MTDIFGQRIEVGDYILYAAATHASDLKIGRVTGFGKEIWNDGREVDAEIHAVTAKYDRFHKKFKVQKTGRAVTMFVSHRTVKLPREFIPAYILALLDAKRDFRYDGKGIRAKEAETELFES